MNDPQKEAREIAERHGIKAYGPPTAKQEPCECRVRKALESIALWLETERGDTNWPQYEKEAASARAALSAPCSCEQLREEGNRLFGILEHRDKECDTYRAGTKAALAELAAARSLLEEAREALSEIACAAPGPTNLSIVVGLESFHGLQKVARAVLAKIEASRTPEVKP